MSTDPAILREAEFNPKLKAYWLWQPVIVFSLTIILIPVALVYLLVGSFLIQKYLDNMACTLTERTLDIKKGIVNKVESTIPLEKITDLQMFQGPIMRMMDLHGFKVETAGQSGGAGGALVNMIGIVDTPSFRKAVLAQRDRLAEGGGSGGATTPSQLASDMGSTSESIEILRDIRDALGRIEGKLDQS